MKYRLDAQTEQHDKLINRIGAQKFFLKLLLQMKNPKFRMIFIRLFVLLVFFFFSYRMTVVMCAVSVPVTVN
jgi:hypothetical protein